MHFTSVFCPMVLVMDINIFKLSITKLNVYIIYSIPFSGNSNKSAEMSKIPVILTCLSLTPQAHWAYVLCATFIYVKQWPWLTCGKLYFRYYRAHVINKAGLFLCYKNKYLLCVSFLLVWRTL